jgi:hypothetical protein
VTDHLSVNVSDDSASAYLAQVIVTLLRFEDEDEDRRPRKNKDPSFVCAYDEVEGDDDSDDDDYDYKEWEIPNEYPDTLLSACAYGRDLAERYPDNETPWTHLRRLLNICQERRHYHWSIREQRDLAAEIAEHALRDALPRASAYEAAQPKRGRSAKKPRIEPPEPDSRAWAGERAQRTSSYALRMLLWIKSIVRFRWANILLLCLPR